MKEKYLIKEMKLQHDVCLLQGASTNRHLRSDPI